jgi:hypothetical protein
MKHTIKHDLSQELARKATRKAFESYAQRFTAYNPTATWKTDDKADVGFKVKGVSLNGTVELRPNAIDLELDVPFLFKIFQKQAMDIIEEEIKVWIGKAKAGEIDG